MKHFVNGLSVGLVFFFIPGFITGNGGLLGSELFSGFLSLGIWGIFLLGVLYATIGGILYGFILRWKIYYQIKISSVKFSGGIMVAYLIFWIVGLLAFYNFGF